MAKLLGTLLAIAALFFVAHSVDAGQSVARLMNSIEANNVDVCHTHCNESPSDLDLAFNACVKFHTPKECITTYNPENNPDYAEQANRQKLYDKCIAKGTRPVKCHQLYE
jgi:hypothetical protein